MPVLVELFVVVGNQAAAARAAQLWRFLPKAFKQYYNLPSPLLIQRRAEAEIALADVYADWTVSTDPEVHVKALIDLFDKGATIINPHSGQPDQRAVIDFYGTHVLPRVNEYLSRL